MNAADWLATDEGHAWLDRTFPPNGRIPALFWIKDDEDFHESGCAEAQWQAADTPAREGAGVPAAQNSAAL